MSQEESKFDECTVGAHFEDDIFIAGKDGKFVLRLLLSPNKETDCVRAYLEFFHPSGKKTAKYRRGIFQFDFKDELDFKIVFPAILDSIAFLAGKRDITQERWASVYEASMKKVCPNIKSDRRHPVLVDFAWRVYEVFQKKDRPRRREALEKFKKFLNEFGGEIDEECMLEVFRSHVVEEVIAK